MNAEIRQKLLELSSQLSSMSLTLNEYREACCENSENHCDLEEFGKMMGDTAQKINDFL